MAAVVLFCVFAIGYGYGTLSYKHGLFTYHVIKALKAALVRKYFPPTLGYSDTGDRKQTACGQFVKDAAVIFTFGQSNSANRGQTRHVSGPGVYNFNFLNGNCYESRDPLLGATGNGGSVWSRLGDLLIESGAYERVLIAPVGVSATSIKRWAPGGDLHARVTVTLRSLLAKGLMVTHMLWHQGEQDASDKMGGDEYVGHFSRLVAAIRSLGVDSPLYAAVASICQDDGSDAIRKAQLALPSMFDNVRLGPNTEVLDSYADRYDGCHFTDLGLDKHARMWLSALLAEGP